MAQKTLEIKELLGSNRNRAPGQVDGVLAPSRVFNLVPDRAGGYTPFGRSLARGITLANMANLVGFDESGLSSYGTVASGSGELELFDGEISYTQDAPAYADIENAAHLDQVGAYISREKFLVLDRDDNQAEGPIVFDINPQQEEEEIGPGGITAGTSRINGIAYGNDRWMVVNEDGEIYELVRNETEPTLVASVGGALRGVAYGNGKWVAIANSSIYYSTDADTSTWTGATVTGFDAGSHGFLGVVHIEGDIFVANGNELFRTTDGGVNWTQVNDTFHSGEAWNDWGYRPAHSTGLTMFMTTNRDPNLWDQSRGLYYSTDNGATWSYDHRGKVSGQQAYHMDVDDSGRFAVVTERGEVWSSFTVSGWSKNTGDLTDGGSLRDIRYNPTTNSWFVVGDNGTLLESQTLGSWTPPLDTVSSAVDLWAVAIADDGTVLAGGTGGQLYTTGSGVGLVAGEYEITTVSYFNTRGGKFVFDINSVTLPLAKKYGNTIEVAVSTQEKVVSDTMSMWGYTYDDVADAAVQARLEAIAAAIKVDVYIRTSLTEEEMGNTEEAETPFEEAVDPSVTVYAFTAELESGASDAFGTIGTIDEEPLGHELGNGKGVTTMVYEHPQTVVHAGRTWGMLSQNDGLFANDGISLALANVSNAYVLGYTEPAWANLLRPDNYLPLRPGQSTAFTGLLSTPSGLMVFFDNEVFVVDGDPASGTLSYELYPDIVGNDDGVTPCRVGGVPFCIWDGQVYALVGGRADAVSGPVYRQDDPFVRIVAESSERSLLALTSLGEVWRYHLEGGFWLVDPSSDGIAELLPNNRADATDNTHYVNTLNEVVVTRRDGTPDTPSITYRGLNFSNPRQRYSVYRVRLPIEGLMVETDRDAIGYNDDLVPHLYIVRAEVPPTDIDAPAGLTPAFARQNEEMFTWTLPLGQAKSRFTDLRLEFQSLDYGDVIAPGVEITYSEAGNRL